MDNINYDELICIVKKSTKCNRQSRVFNGEIIPNIANIGAKKGDYAKLERQGEYYGICVEIMEDVKQLLTDKLIIKILNFLKQENYSTPLNILNLTNLDELHYVLHKWFECATINYNNSLENYKKTYDEYDNWIKCVRSDTLPCKIKIIEIGFNEKTNTSVLPPEWIDCEFENGFVAHKEMDKLETRNGKPPVTFAIIYSMIIQKREKIYKDISKLSYKTIFYLNCDDDGNILTEIKIFNKKNVSRKNYEYVKYNDVLIGFIKDKIFELKTEEEKSNPREVGTLVSRLQKSIRRGKFGAKILQETINKLNSSPNYNLPEHGFLRVSSCRQLVWRLFISILEDCRPYNVDNENIGEIDLLSLILLVLISQKCQEYKFNKIILKSITITALIAQYNDTSSDLFDWRKLPESKSTPIIIKSKYHTALSLALKNITMMSGDKKMLCKLYSAKNNFESFNYPKIKSNLLNSFNYYDEEINNNIIYSSIDHHSKPYILLYYQACIPISMTTKEISSYIWKISSSYNIRSNKKKPKEDIILQEIQKYIFKGQDKKIFIQPQNIKEPNIKQIKPDNNSKRKSFLILFGNEYKHKNYDVILAGTNNNPIKIKLKNEWEYTNDLDAINSYPTKYIYTNRIDPPFGFKWKKFKFCTEIINGKPFVDGNQVKFFDGSIALESIVPKINKKCNNLTKNLVIKFLSGMDIDFLTILSLRENQKQELLNWIPNELDYQYLNFDLIKSVYTKIFNQFNNIIMIGPCDRSGDKMQNSINYYFEGKIWAIFNLLHHLYPQTIIPSGPLNFKIKKQTPGYIHLVTSLETILFSYQLNANEFNKPIKNLPKIITKLWDHQQESVNTILNGFIGGQHGFGDASDVGSGKTLTSLKIATEIIKINKSSHTGILVLLPGNKLIKTWEEELKKHTKYFDIVFQKPSNNIKNIQQNTIVITTLGRIRDSPISHKWLLVIIDECLSVQNKNALQTEQAFIQSLMSKYLIMMSATFFRNRFDKLYYMLKMLQSGLPETKQYLDAILMETIVCKVPVNNKKWFSNINYFELDTTTKNKYNEINNKDLSVEIKYSKLTSFLVSDSKVNNLIIKQLKNLINKLEENDKRCVIYSRSKEEAKNWSKNIKYTSLSRQRNTHYCYLS
ncbi:helicase family protein [Moumouvirus goulette]|uniref:Helicase family protein n=1 Tax=Moumouvirus goulette TaxID=1247379 RepID=M1PN86_9VIRU|nr:helicase family protein [Moumouvirus goulette]AGF85441.1 helicase family protein [Moumouvirus goulette]